MSSQEATVIRVFPHQHPNQHILKIMLILLVLLLNMCYIKTNILNGSPHF